MLEYVFAAGKSRKIPLKWAILAKIPLLPRVFLRLNRVPPDALLSWLTLLRRLAAQRLLEGSAPLCACRAGPPRLSFKQRQQ